MPTMRPNVLLRDRFALSAAGGQADFALLTRDALRRQLSATQRAGEAARHMVAGFAELDVHPDVPDGVRAL
ncbi:hypothetical protein [Streptomyces sp. NPDC056190]|uniref:hypothetical protein n=1 Tax=Streptomyces sp. NPDC056190 TaxID=3345741 RepID=UPI0035D6A910